MKGETVQVAPRTKNLQVSELSTTHSCKSFITKACYCETFLLGSVEFVITASCNIFKRLNRGAAETFQTQATIMMDYDGRRREKSE